jgi:predicted Ser/Thr protein kinase
MNNYSLPNVLIDFENDTFASIQHRMKKFKKQYGREPKHFMCATCKFHNSDEPLHYVHKGRDGIVFTDKNNTIVYKFVDKEENVKSEYECLTAMKGTGLSPVLKGIGKRALTETFVAGITLGDFIHQRVNNKNTNPVSEKLEQNFMHFLNKMIQTGVHNEDSNIYNIIITPSEEFKILDFSYCRRNQSPVDMIAYFVSIFFTDRNSENVQLFFPHTTAHLIDLMCRLDPEERETVDNYIRKPGFCDRKCRSFGL